MSDATLAVSTISVWEVVLLVKKGRLELRTSVSDLLHHCERLPFLEFVPVSSKIALDAVGSQVSGQCGEVGGGFVSFLHAWILPAHRF